MTPPPNPTQDPAQNPAGKRRKGLFRQEALDCFYGPQSASTPDTLPPWQPGPIRVALGIVVVLVLLWLFP